MSSLVGRFTSSLPVRLTALLVGLVALSIGVMAGLGYDKLFNVTEDNAQIRIDRAARAAVSTMVYATNGRFSVTRDEEGRPARLILAEGTERETLRYSPFLDNLLAEIGLNNQGAANLLLFNADTHAFDGFATTFGRPAGLLPPPTLPPPMSIGVDHPAHAALAAARPFQGEVPVMGRLRLAYLTPIVDAEGALAGALAVDVGWKDDLIAARRDLQGALLGFSAFLLVLVGGTGIAWMTREMRPLAQLADFANDVASSRDDAPAPFLGRRDEVGALAQGLARVARLQDELEHLAFTDALTGLGNRACYQRSVKAALAAARNGQRSALLHIDLDRFSRINAAYGTAVGDAVLRHVGTVIAAAFGPHGQLSRQGDDNFAVLLTDCGSAERLQARCRRALKALDDPILFACGTVRVTASIGACLLPDHAGDADTATRNADRALQAARTGSGRFCLFSPHLNDSVRRDLNLESSLRTAIDAGELTVHYQPQIEPNTCRLTGLEALARWTHPTEGPISPAEFIAIAERSDLILKLGQTVLDMACAQARAWLDAGFDFGHVSVNVSPAQLWQPDFVAQVAACLTRHALEGQYLCLELTESMLVDRDDAYVAAKLAELRALSITLSLDDFGSGYSSLGYLHRLPFDQLKIDRAFVRSAPLDSQHGKLLQGVIALGKSLGLSVIAEGAETAEEVGLVRALGVEAVQGYFYARPVPPHEVAGALDAIEAGLDETFVAADALAGHLSA